MSIYNITVLRFSILRKAMNIDGEIQLLYCVEFFRYMPRKEITESHSSSFIKVLRHVQTDFHIDCNNLSSH